MSMPAFARGFTIIELMMTLVIVGVFAAIGIPSMRDLIIGSRVKTAASDLHSSLMFARSEAVKRNAAIDVVPVSTSNWSLGWTVKTGSTVLQTQDAYTTVTFTAPTANVTYSGTGRLSGSSVSFVMYATGYPAITARCIAIDPSGRPNVRVDTDGDASNGC